MKTRWMIVFLGLLACLSTAVEPLAASDEGVVVGQPAPSWDSPLWLGDESPRLPDLKGRVVLVRWWTGPSCPYCRASSSWLNKWHEKYGPDGLVTIGFYHEKSDRQAAPDEVRRLAADLGYRFSIAIDPQWRSLRRWWLDHNPGGFTSMTFLLDRKGVVRMIHPGGSYDPAQARSLEAEITRLLAEE